MKKNHILPLFLLISFFLMLIYPQTVFDGASKGLLLWFRTVLPTLLPYMILNNLMVHTCALHWICRMTSPFLGRIFSTSYYGTFAVLSGFLCGYPVGAKTTSDLLKKRYITYDEAGYLLSFCNNTSPVFVISYVVNQNLQNPSLAIPFLVLLLLAPVLTSFLFRQFYSLHYETEALLFFPAKNISKVHEDLKPEQNPSNHFALFDICIMNAFEALTKIGGYMMLFAIMIQFLSGIFPENPASLLLYSSLELSTGIRMIAHSPYPFSHKLLFSAIITSFGGWCCVIQTRSMTAESGLPLIPYIAEKLVTAMVTSLLISVYICFYAY